MMNKQSALTFMCALVLIMSLGAHANQKKHEEKFCTAFSEFQSDLSTLQKMGSSSTLQDLREASNRVAKDASKVEKEGSKIKTPTAKRFAGAVRQLHQETRSLPENLTIEQAQTRIRDDLKNLRQSASLLATESGCPGEFTKELELQNQMPSG